MNKVTTSVKDCARCGKDHEQLEFNEILNSSEGVEFDYFAICTETSQPILMTIWFEGKP